MKKILILSLTENGGCTQVANSIADNIDVIHETWISSYATEKPKYYDKELKIHSSRKIFLFDFLANFWKYFFQVFIRLLKKDFSCILVMGPHLYDFIFLSLFSFFNIRSYYLVHDGIIHSNAGKKIQQINLNICIALSKNLIFLSAYVKNITYKYHKINKPYLILKHGIIKYDDSNVDNFRLKNDSQFVLSFLGNIHEYKGIHLLIESLDKIDFSKIDKIVIAGHFFVNIDTNRLLKKFPKLEIFDKYLSVDELRRYLAITDILLMPYIEATQSGIAAISVAYAKPAIVTRVGALPEQFNYDAAFFMDEITANCLAEVINSTVKNIDLYNELKKKLIILSEEYSWEKITNQLSDYIKETLSNI